MKKNRKAELRNKVVDEVKSLLYGPRGGEHEIIKSRLHYMYMTGILYPKNSKRSGFQIDDDSSNAAKDELDEFSGDQENPLSMANEFLPSCAGISFNIKKGMGFEIIASAACYEKGEDDNGKRQYTRIPFKEEVIQSQEIRGNGKNIFGNNSTDDPSYFAKLSIIRRDAKFYDDYEIVTVSIINIKNDEAKIDGQNNLYQVRLACKAIDDMFVPYKSSEKRVSTNKEENILNLQYQSHHNFAVGHGVSVDWEVDQENIEKASEVRITYIPSQIIHRPVFDRLSAGERTFDAEQANIAFDITLLASKKAEDDKVLKEKILQSFKELGKFYRIWIEQQKLECEATTKEEKYLIGELNRASKRLLTGVDYLKNDDCWIAFVHANRAMLLQMEQMKRIQKHRSQREKDNQRWPIPVNEEVITNNKEFSSFPQDNQPKWRPFQLVFFLTSFVGLEKNQKEERGLADLIWFATGGGKTEAYLLLSSYEILRRRTRYDNPRIGLGTAVITRYTLRFLTSDQFTRTTSLMCALEKVRIYNKERYGEEPFSAGLYVGGELSYNKYNYKNGAKAAFNDISDYKGSYNGKHKFNIHECPNCGTEIIPFNERDRGVNGENFGIKFENESFVFHCLNSKCLFRGKAPNSNGINIPIKTTDKCIYDNPPSFILATIDKFAMVAMRKEARRIFGFKGLESTLPPSLIIQDEMHLISGPLGTIAAIYEAAFDQLIKKGQANLGIEPYGPKYIASSATVRDSATQLLRLTGRESVIFPARGISASDSFFSVDDDDDDKGRLYLGLMSQGISKQAATDWLNAAIMQAVRYTAEEIKSKEELDFLWTTIGYCNSKRELGLISLSVQQQVYARMKVYAKAQKLKMSSVDIPAKFEISADTIDDISVARNKLLTPVNDNDKSNVVDFVPCTNMISVGIDIDRLGLMVINGQPKTTAEYIQASSRIGRNPKEKGPGLVFTLYAPARPRDRSHYEHFKDYHQSIYRMVEPTSVTPGSMPALKRALHAAIIILLRHGFAEFKENQDAAKFSSLYESEKIKEALEQLKERLISCYSVAFGEESYDYEKNQIEQRFEDIISSWKEWSEKHNSLVFKGSGKEKDAKVLMYGLDDTVTREVGFQTMFSMRSVDVEVKINVN